MVITKLAIIKALIPVIWADGEFGEGEAKMLAALLKLSTLSEQEQSNVWAFAKSRPRVDDIQVPELSVEDRRVVLENAVLLSFADGAQTIDEIAVLQRLAKHLDIGEEEARTIFRTQRTRAQSVAAQLSKER